MSQVAEQFARAWHEKVAKLGPVTNTFDLFIKELDAFARQREVAVLEEAADALQRTTSEGAHEPPVRYAYDGIIALLRERARQRRGATEQEGGGG